MKTVLTVLLFFCLSIQTSFPQADEEILSTEPNYILPVKPPHTAHSPREEPVSMHPSFYDRKNEWQWIIDSTWGPGESLAGKLDAFDIYQEYARAYNATFLWNPINWDSLAASLRSKISDSTSRGGFATILKELSLGMIDGHAYAYDDVVFYTPLNPGIPILVDGGGFINHFGAGLTPLADSSLLVYKVVPNHPLELVPGDIVLGYQGVPWSQLVRELMAGGVPNTIWVGAAPSAYNRSLLWAAGESWHLFDTIDVKKYSTGQVEHLALDPMVTLVAPNNYINNEQLPVPGVPMPDGYYPNHGQVTSGIIDGTNIGYIYVYHEGYPGISSEFDAAVLSLMQTDGLIIDIRLNWGGSYGLNTGISRLINYPTSTLDLRKRCNPNDLFSICPEVQGWYSGEILGDVTTYYDRPVAILLGPNCVSYGDISSWQFSYIPNAKMFGRSPSAAYSGMGYASQPYKNGYTFQCPNLTLVDHYQPDVPRWGQEYPDLEDVWLTPDGVANGEDDVVKSAVEWMNNLVYSHEISADKGFYLAGTDSVIISAIVENPSSHPLVSKVYVRNLDESFVDSTYLNPVTVDNSIQYRGVFYVPNTENIFKLDNVTTDLSTQETFSLNNVARFTTSGPVDIYSLGVTYNSFFKTYSITPYIRNAGQTYTVEDLKVFMTSEDSAITQISGVIQIPSLSPGDTVAQSSYTVRVDTSIFTGEFVFNFEIKSGGWSYWKDTVSYIVTGVENEMTLPEEFSLSQNYPNPFNPSTTIKYGIKERTFVELRVYDILGREVEFLVNEEKDAGYHEINFNSAKLSSGVYLYQLKAGQFIETRKMLLLK